MFFRDPPKYKKGIHGFAYLFAGGNGSGENHHPRSAGLSSPIVGCSPVVPRLPRRRPRGARGSPRGPFYRRCWLVFPAARLGPRACLPGGLLSPPVFIPRPLRAAGFSAPGLYPPLLAPVFPGPCPGVFRPAGALSRCWRLLQTGASSGRGVSLRPFIHRCWRLQGPPPPNWFSAPRGPLSPRCWRRLPAAPRGPGVFRPRRFNPRFGARLPPRLAFPGGPPDFPRGCLLSPLGLSSRRASPGVFPPPGFIPGCFFFRLALKSPLISSSS